MLRYGLGCITFVIITSLARIFSVYDGQLHCLNCQLPYECNFLSGRTIVTIYNCIEAGESYSPLVVCCVVTRTALHW